MRSDSLDSWALLMYVIFQAVYPTVIVILVSLQNTFRVSTFSVHDSSLRDETGEVEMPLSRVTVLTDMEFSSADATHSGDVNETE